jgi:DNA replication protein DnaC
MTQSQLQEQLRSLRLGHFAQALLQQQSQATTYDEMSFEERLGLLAQHEIHCRQDSKVKRLLRQATLRLEAHASRLEYRAERGLRKDKVATLLSGQYLHHAHNIIVTGATGCGKTYFACALARQACEQHHTVRYRRFSR